MSSERTPSNGDLIELDALRGGGSRPADVRRIVIAHPEALLCESLAAHLGADPAIEVVGRVHEPDELADVTRRQRPDGVLVAVVDERFRHGAEALARDEDDVAVVGLVPREKLHEIEQLLAAGLDAVVPTSATPTGLRSAVVAATDSWLVVPPETYREILTRVGSARARLERLDDEQLQLIEAIAEGRTIAEIAESMFVSARTVKRRLASTLERLGCETRTEAIALYGEAGGRFAGNGTVDN